MVKRDCNADKRTLKDELRRYLAHKKKKLDELLQKHAPGEEKDQPSSSRGTPVTVHEVGMAVKMLGRPSDAWGCLHGRVTDVKTKTHVGDDVKRVNKTHHAMLLDEGGYVSVSGDRIASPNSQTDTYDDGVRSRRVGIASVYNGTSRPEGELRRTEEAFEGLLGDSFAGRGGDHDYDDRKGWVPVADGGDDVDFSFDDGKELESESDSDESKSGDGCEEADECRSIFGMTGA